MNITTITFDLDSTDYTAKLAFEVVLNNTVVFATNHVTNPTFVSFDISNDAETDHELKFVLKNKTEEHTICDSHGNIISDAVLSIANLFFENYQLKKLFREKAVYHHDSNGHEPLSEHKFWGSMGCNGHVSLRFSTPVWNWLIESMDYIE